MLTLEKPWTGSGLAKDALPVARKLVLQAAEQRIVLVASLGHDGLAFDIAQQIGAAAAVSGGEAVLIIDTEGGAAGAQAAGDLLDCLDKDASAIESAAIEAAPHLFVLKAARIPATSEIGAAMRRVPVLFETLRKAFPLILIAGGSVNRDAWSNVLAGAAEASLLVIVTGHDRTGDIEKSRDALLALDIPLLGAIACTPDRSTR
jgi:Mrp family chromosome partitioning ATPase